MKSGLILMFWCLVLAIKQAESMPNAQSMPAMSQEEIDKWMPYILNSVSQIIEFRLWWVNN